MKALTSGESGYFSARDLLCISLVNLRLFVIGGLFIGVAGFGSPQNDALSRLEKYRYLSAIPVSHPACELDYSLDVSKDYFVEVANDLPGVPEYNELIRLYKEKQWAVFDKSHRAFMDKFETSPMVEAAGFLMVQTLFDRMDEQNEEILKVAEKSYREIVLRYPKSTLLPVITATGAYFFLRTGQYQKSLGVYKSAAVKYPEQELKCIFELGLGDTAFRLSDNKQAQVSFEKVAGTCQTPFVQIAAKVRLAELQWLNDDLQAEKSYETAVLDNGAKINRYFKAALYNLAEIKFRAGKYADSRLYFNEYFKYEKKEGACHPWARKRLADIAFYTNESWETVLGHYYDVKHHAPNSDIGMFCEAHAFLIDIMNHPEAERKRRYRLIDESLQKIKDQKLQAAGFLEKGFIFLLLDKRDAIDYLKRMSDKLHVNLKEGEAGEFILGHLAKILETVALGISTRNKASRDKDLAWLATTVNEWFCGTEYESEAILFHKMTMIRLFEAFIKERDFKEAYQLLNGWQKAPFFSQVKLDIDEKQRVFEALFYALVDFGQSDKKQGLGKELAMTFLDGMERERIKPFLGERGYYLELVAALLVPNKQKLTTLLSNEPVWRDVAESSGLQSGNFQQATFFVGGMGWALLGKHEAAEGKLTKVQKGPYEERAKEELFRIYQDMRQYKKAMEVGSYLAENYKAGNKRQKQLTKLRALVWDQKMWKEALELVKLSLKLGEPGNASFKYLSGRAHAELGQCKEAIASYEKALTLMPEFSEGNEARFRLAACHLKAKKQLKAKGMWEELVKRKDPFWSPLAQNELNRLK